MPSKTDRWLPLTGALAVILLFAGLIGSGDTPDTDASVAKIVTYYADHDGDLSREAVLLAIAGLLLLLFASALRSALASGEPRPSTWSNAAFAGVISYAVGVFAVAGLALAFSELPDGAAPTVVQTMHVISNDMFFPVMGGSAVMLVASGAAILRGAPLPRWLGWVAIVLGVISLTPAAFFGFMLGFLWLIAVSVLLVLRAGREAPAAGATPVEAPAA